MGFENLNGRVFGQYELRELMGVGGMGAVYRAYQSGLDREVAVKVLPRALAAESGYIERFIREARTAALLEHPHIVRIYDYGTQGDISYLVMALLRGGSLSQRLAQREDANRARASLGEVALMLNAIGSALDYAHHEGVLHRDIKPANIMFDNQGRAYLTDFGIAKLMGATTALTGTGVAMGSPSYMPPEQWAGQDLTPAADQYALGVTIYQTIAGRLPFEADSAAQLMYKHFHEEPTPLTVSRSDIPTSVMLVLNRSMAKSPEQRFPNVTQFAQAFEGAVEGSQGEATNFFLYKLKPDRPRSTSTGISAASGTPSGAGVPPSPTSGQVPSPSGQTPQQSGSYIPPTPPSQPTQGTYPPPGGYTPQGSYPPYQPGHTPPGTYTAPYMQPPTPWYRSPVAIVGGLIVIVGIVIVALLASRGGVLTAEDAFRTQTADAQIALITAQQQTIVAALATDTPTTEPTATTAPTETETLAATETAAPSDTPTDSPTDAPTQAPTDAPTEIVLVVTDTVEPSVTPEPTETFTATNTDTPTEGPTATWTSTATATATPTPTDVPTDTPEPTATDTLPFTSTFTFTPRPTNTPTATATERLGPQIEGLIAPGSVESAAIDDSAPAVLYQFVGTAGQTVSVSVTTTSGNLDPSVHILSPSGDVLATNDDISGTDRNAALTDFTLPEDGTYTVRVERFRGERGNSAGQFELVLSESGGATTVDGSLAYGIPIIGRIDDSVPVLNYAFDAKAGMTISAALYAINGNLDSVLELYSPDGSLVAENDDASPATTNSTIDSYVVETEGTYRLTAMRFRASTGNTSGDFILTLTEGAPAADPNADTVVQLFADSPASGTIDAAHPQRLFSYEGSAGETITLSLNATFGSLDPLLRVLLPNGDELVENDDAALGNSNSLIENLPLTESGTYTIVATRYREENGDTEGTFELLLTQGAGGTTVDCGGELTVGCTAYVSTSMDRPVNVRVEPRPAAAVVTSVASGTPVVLIDGPQIGEGFTWWKVRLQDGSEGWMVERIGFNDVLVPEAP